MKNYIKPTLEMIELRVDEEIASGSASMQGKQIANYWGVFPMCGSSGPQNPGKGQGQDKGKGKGKGQGQGKGKKRRG